jgi:hypothetical protein
VPESVCAACLVTRTEVCSREGAAATVMLYVAYLGALLLGSDAGNVITVALQLDGLDLSSLYQVSASFCKHRKAVRALEYIPAFKYVVSGGTDRDIRMWEPRTGRPIATFRGHTAPVSRLLFAAVSQMLVSLDTSSVVKFWSVTSEVVLQSFNCLSHPLLTQRRHILDMVLAGTQKGSDKRAAKPSHIDSESLIFGCNRLRIWRLRASGVANVSPALGNGTAQGGEEQCNDEPKTFIKPACLHQHAIAAVLVCVVKERKSILSVDSSGLVCEWDMRSGAQSSCFQADRPQQMHTNKDSEDRLPAPISSRITAASFHQDSAFSKWHRFKPHRSRRARELITGAPCAQTPKHNEFGLEHVLGDDVVLLTAATLDLLQLRVAMGWSNGAVHLYSFSGTILQELVSTATSAIVSLAAVERQFHSETRAKSGRNEEDEDEDEEELLTSKERVREDEAYLIAAEEKGIVWFWPNSLANHERKVMFVKSIFDFNVLPTDRQISVMKAGHGIVATGSINGGLICRSLFTGNVLSKTEVKGCECLLLLPAPLATHSSAQLQEAPLLVAADSEGLVIISNTSNAQILCQFSVARAEDFKRAHVCAMCTDVDNTFGKPQLLFVGDSNGKLYTFFIGGALYPLDFAVTTPPGPAVMHMREPASLPALQHAASGGGVLKLFETDAFDRGVSSIQVVASTLEAWGGAPAQYSNSNLFVLVVGALDGSVSLFSSNLVAIMTLSSAPFAPAQYRETLTMMMTAGAACVQAGPHAQLRTRTGTESSIENRERERETERAAALFILSWWRKKQLVDLHALADTQLVFCGEDGEQSQYASKLVLHRLHKNKGKWWPPPTPSDRLTWYLERCPPRPQPLPLSARLTTPHITDTNSKVKMQEEGKSEVLHSLSTRRFASAQEQKASTCRSPDAASSPAAPPRFDVLRIQEVSICDSPTPLAAVRCVPTERACFDAREQRHCVSMSARPSGRYCGASSYRDSLALVGAQTARPLAASEFRTMQTEGQTISTSPPPPLASGPPDTLVSASFGSAPAQESKEVGVQGLRHAAKYHHHHRHILSISTSSSNCWTQTLRGNDRRPTAPSQSLKQAGARQKENVFDAGGDSGVSLGSPAMLDPFISPCDPPASSKLVHAANEEEVIASSQRLPPDCIRLPTGVDHDYLPGSFLALQHERLLYKVQHSASAARSTLSEPPQSPPPSWRRQGVDKFSGQFSRASFLPLPPNHSNTRKRLSGLSLYSLANLRDLQPPAARPAVDIREHRWREKEKEMEKEVAKAALRDRVRGGGAQDRNQDHNHQMLEKELRKEKAAHR